MTRRLLGVLAAAGVLVTAGCSSGSGERVASTPGTTAAVPTTALPTTDSVAPSVAPQAPAAASVLPGLSVDDVAAGTKVDLSSLAPADRPLLVWFWAPH